MPQLRCLGVLLCYNDGDLLEESIRYLLEQDHDLIVWDHGSTDETPSVINRFRSELLETRWLPREFDFYELYPEMSRHLIANRARDYDWISWPDQDEFLEGPARDRPYRDYLLEARRVGGRLDPVQQLQLLVDRRGRPRHRLTDPEGAPLFALARLPAARPGLARAANQHPRVQPQPARGSPRAAGVQPPPLPDALPRPDARPGPARPRRIAPRPHELPLRADG